MTATSTKPPTKLGLGGAAESIEQVGSWQSVLAQAIERLVGPRATSQAVAVPILLLLSLNISQAGYGDTAKSGPAQVQTVFWAFNAGWAFFTVVGALINRSFPAPSVWRSALVLGLFGSTEILRTSVVYFVALQMGLYPEAQWEVRIPAAASSGLVFFGIISNVINNTQLYRSVYRGLFERRVRLESMLQASADTLEQTRALLRRRVRAQLEASLFSTMAEMHNVAPRFSLVIDRIFSVVDDVVRPASHELFERPTVLHEKELTVQAPHVRLRTLLREATLAVPFRPVMTFGIFVALFLPVLFALKDPAFIAPVILATLPLLIGNDLARRWALPHFPRWSFAGRAILASFVYAIPAGLLLAVMQLAFRVEANPIILVTYGCILGLVVGWGLAILAGLRQVREAMLAELAVLNDELDWNLTRMQSQVWADQKALALTLHSDVQGMLLAAALKLRSALDTPDSDSKAPDTGNLAVLDEVQAMVTGVLDVETLETDAASIEQIVGRLNDTWDQLISMSLEASPDVLARVNSDPVALRVLDDIITEFQTNSVKHGKATRTDVIITLPQRGIAKIEMRNDGSREPVASSTGLGLQFLQSVTLKYRFDTAPVYRLTIQIPLAK
jgi:signal transduction histidine kinase